MLGNRNLLLAAAGIGETFGEKIADPSPVPAGNVTGVVFSPDGNALIVTHATSPFITAYGWSSSGFGAKYANPQTLPVSSSSAGLVFTTTGSHIITTESDTAGRLVAYQWSSSTGFGSKQTLGISNIIPRSLAMSPLGTHIAMAGLGQTTLKPLQIVPWTGTGFGSTVATIPNTIAGDDALCLAFSPNGGHVLIGSDSTFAYQFSGGVLSNPTIAPGATNTARSIAFDRTGAFVAFGRFLSGGGGRGRLEIANWSASGFGTLIETGNIPPIFNGGSNSVCFTPSELNNIIAVGTSNSQYPLNVFRWSGSSIRHRFADPLILPTGAAPSHRGVAFSPSGDAMVVGHATSPFITAYKITAN